MPQVSRGGSGLPGKQRPPRAGERGQPGSATGTLRGRGKAPSFGSPSRGGPPGALPSPNPPRFGGAGAALPGAASPCSSPAPGPPLRLRDLFFFAPLPTLVCLENPAARLPERRASLRGFPKKNPPRAPAGPGADFQPLTPPGEPRWRGTTLPLLFYFIFISPPHLFFWGRPSRRGGAGARKAGERGGNLFRVGWRGEGRGWGSGREVSAPGNVSWQQSDGRFPAGRCAPLRSRPRAQRLPRHPWRRRRRRGAGGRAPPFRAAG